jgi:hypothetical protein
MELVFRGIHPVDARFCDLFRLYFNMKVLDMPQAEEAFFISFCRASGRPLVPGFANFNACPDLRHLLLCHISLVDIQGLLETWEIMGFPQLQRVMAQNSGNESRIYITTSCSPFLLRRK